MSKFLHDNNEDAKAIAIIWVSSVNSQANKRENNQVFLSIHSAFMETHATFRKSHHDDL